MRVLFFARFRERLNCAELELALAPASLAALKQQLAERGDRWAEVMSADSLLVAVNQQMISGDVALAAGDEVAFFPPVTGG